MRSSLPSAPVLKSFNTRVGAVHYNSIFLALRRWGGPLELMVPAMGGFEVRIDRDAWVCFDRNLNYQPLLAWSEFRANARSGLYEPVPCRLLFYHAYAAVLVRSLPVDIHRLLLKRFPRQHQPAPARVLPF